LGESIPTKWQKPWEQADPDSFKAKAILLVGSH
jgi:hypothetical protein